MRIGLGHLVIVSLLGCATAKDDDKRAKVTPAREVVSGGATLRGGGVRMDVQIGRPFAQKTTKSGDAKAKPGAVVSP